MRSILLFVTALILAACAPPPAAGESVTGATVTETPATDHSEQSCRAQGGTLRPVCLMGKVTCVLAYADAGKPCTGKAQCLGQCRFEGKKPVAPEASVVGTCQRTTNPCGCFGLVENGKLQAMMCVD